MSILEVALEYKAIGLSVIPLEFRGKKSLVKWTEYQERQSTEEEIKQWWTQWPNANIAIVTGRVSGIVVLDVDGPEGEETVKAMAPLPETPTVRTGRGLHYYFKYKEGVRNFQKKESLKGIDLRGDGGYVVTSPSIHENGKKYEWIKPINVPLAELPEWVLMEKPEDKAPIAGLYKGVVKGQRNVSLTRLVGSWVKDGLSFEECVESAGLVNDRNIPPLSYSEVEKIVNSIYGRHHRREKMNDKNVEVTKDVKDTNFKYIANFTGLVDIGINNEGKANFIVLQDGDLQIRDNITLNNQVYIPPPIDIIPWLLPKTEEILRWYKEDSDQALYQDLLNYHKGISELPDESYYDLIVAWDLHTYLSEAVQYSPIICLFAVPERGKSRTGKGMIYVAYRGMHVESLREAYLLRATENFGATIFFDVMDIWKKAEKEGSEDILLHRFEKGAKVYRVLNPEAGAFKDTKAFSVFGPTVISTNEGVHRILETRAIQINMPETNKRFENDVTPEESLSLKERLVAFRARHLGESLPHVPKPAIGRLGDILRPILQIICMLNPNRGESFWKLIRRIEKERLIEKGETFEAEVLGAVIKSEQHVTNGTLSIKEITTMLNSGRLDNRYQITPQKVGRILKAMGIDKGKTGNGGSAIYWNQEKIERLKERYGLKETSDTSEIPVMAIGQK